MLSQPKFKNCFTVEIIKSVGVFLISESDSFVLSGPLYELLTPLIDGQNTSDEIVAKLRNQASPAEIYYTLALLEKQGHLIENDTSLPAETAAFYTLLNISPQQAASRLQSLKVAVISYSQIPAAACISALETLGIQTSTTADITVILTDDYLQPELNEFNQKALQTGRPWLLIKPTTSTIWIGPIFHPETTACWECLAQRLRANRPTHSFIQRQKHYSTPLLTPPSYLPATLQIAFNLAATELGKWIVQSNNKTLENTIVTFDTKTLKTTNHTITKRPQCPECGQLPPQEIQPFILQSQKKNFTADGGHRSFSPTETLKKFDAQISPITGVVRGLLKVPQTTNALTPNYIAGHNFATMFDDLYFLKENLRGRSAGKGKSDEQAKASALGEAIERYSGVYQGDEIRKKGSYQSMGEAAIHPNDCMGFSEAQYRDRHEWNRTCQSFFQRVPEPFDTSREIDWTPIWSLTHQRVKYLPTAYCYYGYPKPEKPDCWSDSNGAAAGNTKEEAILQGFMELVERDSVGLWWYNRIKVPAVDLDSFNDTYIQELRNYYQSIGRTLWVLDLTNDFNIPVFAALSHRIDRKIEDIIFGFGAHFDPKIAISRALTEVNQSLPSVLTCNADGSTNYGVSDGLTVEWYKTATLENKSYLTPDTSQPLKLLSDYPPLASDDLKTDVEKCVKIAETLGLETFVLDQTRPDIGLNVIKVIVPGMRHFWKRLAPGRLYDIPVKLGWLDAPTLEHKINPFPIFF